MIGYKATDMYSYCLGFKFEVGKTYTKDTPKEDLRCCTDKGIHICRELWAHDTATDKEKKMHKKEIETCEGI